MISLTSAAIKKIKSVLAEQGENLGLRIAVIGSGCNGMQYTMKLDKSPTGMDEVIDIDGIRVILDRQSSIYLSGASIDYVDGKEGSGFKFNNPNVHTSCGCGETFEA